MPARAKTLFGWLVGVVVLMGLATIVFGISAIQLYSSFGWVDHTHRVIAQTQKLLGHVLDAETGQRGYLLTGDATYLTPYQTGVLASRADIDSFADIVGDNPAQLNRIAQLRPMVERKLAELEQTITLYRAGRQYEARQMIKTDAGKVTMDAIRQTLDFIGVEERLLLDRRTEALMRNFSYTGLAAAAGLVLGLPALLVLGAQLGLSQVRESRLRQSLEEVNRDLEQRVSARTAALTEALEAKDRFLANMTHELRSPLNAVIGFAELIEQGLHGPVGDPRYKEYAGHIQTGGQHLLGLINDLLDMARLQAGRFVLHLEPQDPAALLRTCVGLMQATARQADVTLELDLANPPPRITADPTRLRQVVLNLISNAIKYTPAGKKVLVRAESTDDAKLRLKVIDEGIGVAPEDMPRIFQPFEQVDNLPNRHNRGSGLGLPLSVQLVELHGGRLWLESAPNIGTTAMVEL